MIQWIKGIWELLTHKCKPVEMTKTTNLQGVPYTTYRCEICNMKWAVKD